MFFTKLSENFFHEGKFGITNIKTIINVKQMGVLAFNFTQEQCTIVVVSFFSVSELYK